MTVFGEIVRKVPRGMGSGKSELLYLAQELVASAGSISLDLSRQIASIDHG